MIQEEDVHYFDQRADDIDQLQHQEYTDSNAPSSSRLPADEDELLDFPSTREAADQCDRPDPVSDLSNGAAQLSLMQTAAGSELVELAEGLSDPAVSFQEPGDQLGGLVDYPSQREVCEHPTPSRQRSAPLVPEGGAGVAAAPHMAAHIILTETSTPHGTPSSRQMGGGAKATPSGTTPSATLAAGGGGKGFAHALFTSKVTLMWRLGRKRGAARLACSTAARR